MTAIILLPATIAKKDNTELTSEATTQEIQESSTTIEVTDEPEPEIVIEEIETAKQSDLGEFVSYNVSTIKSFKSYMSYKAITNTGSKAYAIQHTYAYTGDYGIRQVDNRYCVAIGSGFNASVGTYIDVVLENNTVIQCVVSDIKDDGDTDADNMITLSNGCACEFVVDISALDSNAKRSGDMSACDENWKSRVVKIKVYEKNILN